MSGPDVTPDLVLDCRGMRCPMPVIVLGRRIGEVPAGGVVAVESDDVAARVDVPAWCRMREQDYLGETTAADGVPAYLVRRVPQQTQDRCGSTSAVAASP